MIITTTDLDLERSIFNFLFLIVVSITEIRYLRLSMRYILAGSKKQLSCCFAGVGEKNYDFSLKPKVAASATWYYYFRLHLNLYLYLHLFNRSWDIYVKLGHTIFWRLSKIQKILISVIRHLVLRKSSGKVMIDWLIHHWKISKDSISVCIQNDNESFMCQMKTSIIYTIVFLLWILEL
jgi:hypothetical protein